MGGQLCQISNKRLQSNRKKTVWGYPPFSRPASIKNGLSPKLQRFTMLITTQLYYNEENSITWRHTQHCILVQSFPHSGPTPSGSTHAVCSRSARVVIAHLLEVDGADGIVRLFVSPEAPRLLLKTETNTLTAGSTAALPDGGTEHRTCRRHGQPP